MTKKEIETLRNQVNNIRQAADKVTEFEPIDPEIDGPPTAISLEVIAMNLEGILKKYDK